MSRTYYNQIIFLILFYSRWINCRGPNLPKAHLSLSSLDWRLENSNRSISLKTDFINQPHLALIQAGMIDEPNIGLNEGTVRWVGEDDWSWESELSIETNSSLWIHVDRYYLYFGGLDTFCEVKIRDRVIGKTDNAFRSWIFDITETIKSVEGDKVILPIKLTFKSAYKVARDLAHTPGNTWFPDRQGNKATTMQIFEYNYRNYARKQQSDFGWDWGAAYLPCGPIQPAHLIGLSTPNSTQEKKVGLLNQTVSDPSKRINPVHHHQNTTTSALVLQKRQSSDPLPWEDRTTTFWIHRTGIDIYRRGQKNNLHPDPSQPWIINITLPISSTQSIHHDDPMMISGQIKELSLELPFQALKLLKPIDYLQDGPDYFLSTTFMIDKKIEEERIELWYPTSLGKPKLYDFELRLKWNLTHDDDQKKIRLIQDSDRDQDHVSDDHQTSWIERIGFRTIVIDQSRYSQDEVKRGITPGTRFTFNINGKPFYVQGSSMIPIDQFNSRTNSSTMRWLLESALLAHQNVIRIWGGGAYQTDEFYDMCDELGILAWSETVFACAGYPIRPIGFLNNIRSEVLENVIRLNRHPSLALLAGNNEGEGYLISVNRTWENGTIYFNEYDYLYNHVIRDVVLENTRSISYIPSSTTQGYLSLDPYVSRYYNSTPGEIYGDQELYNYDTTVSFDLNSYPVARFVNEFGFHSMPSIYTWDRILNTPEAYDFNSSVIRAHNKHPPAQSLVYPFPADEGQKELTTGVTDWYPQPKMIKDKRALLAQWSYSTQVFQSDFMSSQIAYYRLGASRGENNMGALYWQLNDVWEGISWSSIEYTGRWKLFHYLAERVQDHVIISPIYHRKNQTLEIYVTSDLWESVTGIAQWTWYDYAGKKLVSTDQAFQVGPINSTRLERFEGLQRMVPIGQDPKDAWLHLQLKDQEGHYLNEQFFHPIPLKDAKLRESRVKVRGIGKNLISLEIEYGGVAVWVNVEHPPGVRGYFKDVKSGKPSNGFFLLPDQMRTLEFILYDQDDHQILIGLENKMVVRILNQE